MLEYAIAPIGVEVGNARTNSSSGASFWDTAKRISIIFLGPIWLYADSSAAQHQHLPA
jgi:hypothetical protein